MDSRPRLDTSRATRLSLLAALFAVSGCSLVIDSGSYVQPSNDAGPRDFGTDGDIDLGFFECGEVPCPGGWSCLDGWQCVECEVDDQCASGLCDPGYHYCLGSINDCSDCNEWEVCVPLPSGTGNTCVTCDRDGDGFLVDWAACDFIDDRQQARDCDDLDYHRHPESAPVCNDGFRQTCPSEALDALAATWFVGEVGQLPVRDIAAGVAYPSQLSVRALPPYTVPGVASSQNEAVWAHAFVNSQSEGELHFSAHVGYDPASGQQFWQGHEVGLRSLPSWPFEANSIRAFTAGHANGLVVIGVLGTASDTSQARVFALSSGDLTTYYEQETGWDVHAPLAFRGDGYIELFFRQSNPFDGSFSQLATLNWSTTDAHPIRSDWDLLLDTESGYVIVPDATGRHAEVWDGNADTPLSLGTPSSDSLVGPPRFSRDLINGVFIALLPYSSGVRVVRFDCEGAQDLESCNPEVTGIQPVLPNLSRYDLEMYNGTVVVVESPVQGSVGRVVGHILSLGSNLTLTPQTTQPFRIVGDHVPAGGVPTTITAVHGIETDIDFGQYHVEIVVGATVDLEGWGTHVLGTSLRACSAL